MMNEWTPICRIDDIPVLGSRRVARPQGPVSYTHLTLPTNREV